MTQKVSKAKVKVERSSSKLKSALVAKGLPNGKAPAGKVVHHVKPVAEGGKTTPGNLRLVTKSKHVQIHNNRRKAGKI